jgi:hypothetical protein
VHPSAVCLGAENAAVGARRSSVVRLLVVALAVSMVGLTGAGPASASYPGRAGMLAFDGALRLDRCQRGRDRRLRAAAGRAGWEDTS